MIWDLELAERERALKGLERIWGREIQAEANALDLNDCGKLESPSVLTPSLRSKVFALIRMFPSVGNWRA